VPSTNYYRTLQVDPAAESEVIQAAYRRLAQLYHPDVNHAPDAEQRMREINEAWEVLRDPEKRRAYDAYLAQESAPRERGGDTAQGRDGEPAGDSDFPGSHERPGSGKSAPESDHSSHMEASCRRCGRTDPTLRMCAFPWVISIVILTFRRSWSGVYCESCRKVMMRRAKLMTLLLGWWGVPFGPIASLMVLFTASQGLIPREANGAYLSALGALLYQQGRPHDAARAWDHSLAYKDSAELRAVYTAVFGKPPTRVQLQHGQGSGALFGLASAAGVALIVWQFVLGGPLPQLSAAQPGAYVYPSVRTSVPSVLPTVRPTATRPRLTGSAPYEDTRLYWNRQCEYGVQVPRSYSVDEWVDPEQADSYGVIISDEMLVGPEDAVIGILAFENPTPQSGWDEEPARDYALDLLNASVEILDGWEPISAAKTIRRPSAMRAEVSGTVPVIDGGDELRYVRATTLVYSDWVYLIVVSGSDRFRSAVDAHYSVVVSSFHRRDS